MFCSKRAAVWWAWTVWPPPENHGRRTVVQGVWRGLRAYGRFFPAAGPAHAAAPGPARRECALRALCRRGGAALRLGQAFCYGVFDCSRMALAGTRAPCPPRRLLLLRALTACTPFSARALRRARLLCHFARGRRRAFWRATAAALCAFEGKWIPMENAYAAAFGIRESCGVLLQAQPGGAQGQHV